MTAQSVSLAEFNAAADADAAALLRPCLDVDRWVDDVLSGRPYAARADLTRAGQQAASPLRTAEIEAALAHHPRIGERASGTTSESAFSRAEQSTVGDDSDVQSQLRAGNIAYEQQFGRIFLIRAKGRDAAEILVALRQRLDNDPAAEDQVVSDQLHEIAVLRLQESVTE